MVKTKRGKDELVVFTLKNFCIIDNQTSDFAYESVALAYDSCVSGFEPSYSRCILALMRDKQFINKIRWRAFELHGCGNPRKIICDADRCEIRVVP